MHHPPIIPPRFSASRPVIANLAGAANIRLYDAGNESVNVAAPICRTIVQRTLSVKLAISSNRRGPALSRDRHRGASFMKICIRQAVCVALMAAGLVGCQSGPRWAKMPERLAWWKKDAPATAAAESSLDARTAGLTAEVAAPAAPVLPSTLATPESLTAASQPPSAKSVAAVPPLSSTVGTTTTPPIANVPTSSVPTIASAPSAAYPTTTYPTTTTPSATASAPVAAAAQAATTPSTVMAQAGPYDPTAYQPVAAQVPAAPVEADRYGMAATPAAAPAPVAASAPTSTTPIAATAPIAAGAQSNPAAPAAAERYAAPAATTAAAAPSASDRYAAAPSYSYSDDRYGASSAAPSTSAVTPAVTTPSTIASTSPAVTPAIPQTATPPYNAATVASATSTGTVQITAPAGQYRPGGTSTYTGAPTNAIEVASRPSTTTAIPTPQIPTASPLPGQVPIYPTGNTSTRTY